MVLVIVAVAASGLFSSNSSARRRSSISYCCAHFAAQASAVLTASGCGGVARPQSLQKGPARWSFSAWKKATG
jgi:hypothetical protein